MAVLVNGLSFYTLPRTLPEMPLCPGPGGPGRGFVRTGSVLQVGCNECTVVREWIF